MGIEPLEYCNDFIYFVVRPAMKDGRVDILYCSGVNLRKMLPITGGRHGLASSPALRGLQIVNRNLRALALSKQMQPRTLKDNGCPDVRHTDDLWYSETLMIENACVSFPVEIIEHCVGDFLRTINKSCRLGEKLPDELIDEAELQILLENWSKKHDVKMRRSKSYYRFSE